MKKNFIIYTILLLGITFNTKANEINTNKKDVKANEVKNKLMFGLDFGALMSEGEFYKKDYKITGNVSLEGSGMTVEPNLSYKMYFSKQGNKSLFITPQISYSLLGKIKSDDSLNVGAQKSFVDLELSKTYSASLSLGLEINKKHSFSLGLGVQGVDYDYKYTSTGTVKYAFESSSSIGLFYSAMYEYNINESFAINAKFSMLNFNFDTPNKDLVLIKPLGAGTTILDEFDVNVSSITIGFNYRY